jgi:hypothetical protein
MGPGAGGGVLGHPLPRIVHSTTTGFGLPIHTTEASSSHHPPSPEMEFPKFDDSNPRLWQDQCEVYFEVYTVEEMMKTRFASLNFKGSTATWLQTVEHCGRIVDWSNLCDLVMVKYNKDLYQILLWQLDSLKQTSLVLEYQATFEKLAHGIVLYNPAIDDTFFVTQFVSGLREDIRVPLMLHCSGDVDTASALALI